MWWSLGMWWALDMYSIAIPTFYGFSNFVLAYVEAFKRTAQTSLGNGSFGLWTDTLNSQISLQCKCICSIPYAATLAIF